MKFEVVNQDVRYLRDYCPMTIATVTGCGQGSVCRCECEPEPEPTPVIRKAPNNCKIKVKTGGNLKITTSNSSRSIRVCN